MPGPAADSLFASSLALHETVSPCPAPAFAARPGHATAEGLAAPRAIAETQLSPAGQLPVAMAVDMLTALDAHLDALRRLLLEAARHVTGAKVLRHRLYGVGPITALALTCRLGGAGGSPARARQPGSPGWTSPCNPRQASAPPSTCPGKAPSYRLFVGTRRVRVYECRVSPAVTARGRSGLRCRRCACFRM